MAISEKQFVYLQEMGINLWQRKSISAPEVKDTSSQTDGSEHTVEINDLLSQRFFLDIIHALALQPADFSQVSPNKLQCDDFVWKFINDATIEFENNLLTTPPVSDFLQQPALKKHLYQQLLPMLNTNNID